MTGIKLILILIVAFVLLSAGTAFAHCPLCTAGAGVAAVGARWLGFNDASIGVFIGAFAVALGFWLGKAIKRRFVPHQEYGLAIISFLLTVLPLMPLMSGVFPIVLDFAGDYGSILNRTYIVSWFLFSAVLGGFIVLAAPAVSRKITGLRKDKTLPYQGLSITFGLLIALSVFFEIWL